MERCPGRGGGGCSRQSEELVQRPREEGHSENDNQHGCGADSKGERRRTWFTKGLVGHAEQLRLDSWGSWSLPDREVMYYA